MKLDDFMKELSAALAGRDDKALTSLREAIEGSDLDLESLTLCAYMTDGSTVYLTARKFP